MHAKSFQTRVHHGLSSERKPAEVNSISLPVVFGFVVATICFGAARIHASGSIASVEKPLDLPAFTTRVVEFKPHEFAPSAFADWFEHPPARQ